MSASVLVVTNARDVGADLVVHELARRHVSLLRCNTEELTGWDVECEPGHHWRLVDPFGRAALSECVSGVWWRRPAAPDSRSGLTPGEDAAVAAQWQALCEGLTSVPGPKWISKPNTIRAAEDKQRQLAVAAGLGLRIPRTLVTNQLSAAKRFVAEGGGAVVVKSLTAAAWEEDGRAGFVFAQLVGHEELPVQAESLAAAPVVLQCAIWPKRDVRATIVGRRCFAAMAPEGDKLDWRSQPEGAWDAVALPPEIESACIQLVVALGLRFGGIDLVVDAAGEYWFMEINPNGEWGWLDQRAGLPIASALADELTRL